MILSHADLVERARRWLLGRHRCKVVFTDAGCQVFSEIVDAMGFSLRKCVVVECKTSLSDFYADRRKPHRRASQSMGDERWFLTPPHVLSGKGLNLDGHGLAEVRGKIVRVVTAPERVPLTGERAWRERAMLVKQIAWERELAQRGTTNGHEP